MQKRNINIVLSNSAMEVQRLLSQGFCPIDCDFNGDPIVDDLFVSDRLSHGALDGYVIRSYRDLYGAREDDPRFVVSKALTPGMALSIGALSGILPHSRNIEKLRHGEISILCSDVTGLTMTVDAFSKSSSGVDLTKLKMGGHLLAWLDLYGQTSDLLGSYMGVSGWRKILLQPEEIKQYINTAVQKEEARIYQIKSDDKRMELISGVKVILNATSNGFEFWHGLKTFESNPESVDSWEFPVIIAQDEQSKDVMIKCPNSSVGKKLFGGGGIVDVLHHLKPDGWTGSASYGISPCLKKPSSKQIYTAAKKLAYCLKFNGG